ncbi:MAG: CYTH domain-containing protein [Alistipes sp.]|nr:CYTH domain-containing protein [Alistipes sp.]
MAEEIERKFLVVGEYKHLAHSSSHLVQGYIASGRRTVRVRLSDDRAWLTIKGPSRDGGLSRYEWEREIDATEAMELLHLAEGALIDKRRWLVEYEGHTFEVDEFAGDNEGLTIAEVELSSTDEAFARPLWLGREVTGERRFYNSHLRAHPYSEWSAEERE